LSSSLKYWFDSAASANFSWGMSPNVAWGFSTAGSPIHTSTSSSQGFQYVGTCFRYSSGTSVQVERRTRSLFTIMVTMPPAFWASIAIASIMPRLCLPPAMTTWSPGCTEADVLTSWPASFASSWAIAWPGSATSARSAPRARDLGTGMRIGLDMRHLRRETVGSSGTP